MHRLLDLQIQRIWGEGFDISTLDENTRKLIEVVEEAYGFDDEQARILEDILKSTSDDLMRQLMELEDVNQTLQQSMDDLKKTQAQLVQAEKEASLSSLVAGVAHEINTPVGVGLTGITHVIDLTENLLNLYRNGEMSQGDFDEYFESVQSLHRSIHFNMGRAAELVKSFKQVAVDQTSAEKRQFDLKTYLREILTSLHNVVKKAQHNVTVSCPEGLVITNFPGAFSQVFTNLIMNSIIHGYDKGQAGNMAIEVQPDNGRLNIIYCDDGKGIPAANLKYIFDPFFTTKRDSGGSGLGLHILFNIVTQQLKGSVRCESEPGQGVKFMIQVPAEV